MTKERACQIRGCGAALSIIRRAQRKLTFGGRFKSARAVAGYMHIASQSWSDAAWLSLSLSLLRARKTGTPRDFLPKIALGMSEIAFRALLSVRCSSATTSFVRCAGISSSSSSIRRSDNREIERGAKSGHKPKSLESNYRIGFDRTKKEGREKREKEARKLVLF